MIDLDPAFARDYINTLVNIYVEENLADKREESYGANRFLAEQVTFYKQKLDEIDAKIIDFQKADRYLLDCQRSHGHGPDCQR